MTDPDSRIMESGGAFLQAFNCQAAVDDANQIIVAADITNQAPDAGNLAPMLAQVRSNCGPPGNLTADSGYWTSGVEETCAEGGTEAWVAVERRKHWGADTSVTEGPPPEDATPRGRMRHRLRTLDGRRIYSRRKAVVEPVFGQLKEGRGFRRFHLRGLVAATAEWMLVCATHNLLELFRGGVGLGAA